MSNPTVSEELDFAYLLGLMRPLHNIDEYSSLPELFTILGHDKLIDLCRYCGGETIKLPTPKELIDAIDALQVFYDVYIVRRKSEDDIPITSEELVNKIKEVYFARSAQTETS